MRMSFEEERVASPAADRFDDAPGSSLAPISVGEVTAEEKQWGMFCHLSALVAHFLTTGAFPLLGPLICWLIKKDTSRFVDYHGKEALNFQINILAYTLICFVTILGIFLIPIVIVYSIVMAIIAGMKANEGQLYEYPYTFRLIK
jgi:uncharacterized Tic20 family protein